MASVTIRRAWPDDETAIARLAALDSQPVPRGELLVADVEGELWAAVAIDASAAIADPFHPTADLVELLRSRAAQLRAAGLPRRRLRATARRLLRPVE
jgi:hypothetical protein